MIQDLNVTSDSRTA